MSNVCHDVDAAVNAPRLRVPPRTPSDPSTDVLSVRGTCKQLQL